MPVGKVVIDVAANTAKLVDGMNSAERAVKKGAGAIKNAMAGVVAAISVDKIVKYGDTWTEINSRLKLVTDSTKQLTDVQQKLFKTSQDSRNSFEATATLYTKMARSTQELNVSSEELISIVDTINKALTVSGSTSVEAEAALRQLGQGMASGVLRGEELNSVMEQTPRLAEAIAKGMGITIGELRKFGAEGKITAEAVLNALQSQKDVIEAEFQEMPLTVSQSFTQLQNVALKTIGELNKVFGGNEGLAGAISFAAEYLEDFTEGFIVLSGYVKSVGTLISTVLTAVGMTIKNKLLSDLELVKEGFNTFAAYVAGKMLDIGIIINQGLKAIGQDGLDLSGINYAFNSLTDKAQQSSNAIKQYGEETGQAWQKVFDYSIIAQAEENIEKMNKGLQFTSNKVHGLDGNLKDADKTSTKFGSTLEGGLSRAFSNVQSGAFDLKDTMKNILNDIIAQFVKVAVIQQALYGAGGSSSDVKGGLFSMFASGGAFQGGRVKAFANGGVVNSPTFFPMSGGNTGLMGEAGAEAIVPLKRTAGGDLGVQASPVNVTVINNAGAEVSTRTDGEGNIQIILDAISNSISRGTGSIGNALESRYGLSKV